MARQTGGRLAWKDRIDRSAWVDDTAWVDEGGPAAGDQSVEFLEAEPSAYRLSGSSATESTSLFDSTSAKLIGLGALAIVLVSLGLLSRPGDQDPFSQLPPDKQQEIRQRQAGEAAAAGEAGDATGTGDPDAAAGQDASEAGDDAGRPQPIPTPSVDGEAGSSDGAEADGGGDGAGADGADGAVTLAPLQPLREELRALPGLLVGHGEDAVLVRIAAGEERPVAEALPGGAQPGSLVQVADGDVFGLVDGQLMLIGPDGVEPSALVADALAPADDGALLIEESRQGRLVTNPTAARQAAAGAGPAAEPVQLGHDVVLLGGWQGRLLVHKAGTVWLVDGAGGAEAVTTGQVVGFDGRHLVTVACDRPDQCRVAVGPPDQPARRSVPVPPTLADRELAAWTARWAVSADGDRLAVVDSRGVSLPSWIDLVTGEEHSKSESIRRDSPIAWSPDGRWLTFALADDDLLIWDTDSDEAWWVFIDHPLTDLVWVDGPPGG